MLLGSNGKLDVRLVTQLIEVETGQVKVVTLPDPKEKGQSTLSIMIAANTQYGPIVTGYQQDIGNTELGRLLESRISQAINRLVEFYDQVPRQHHQPIIIYFPYQAFPKLGDLVDIYLGQDLVGLAQIMEIKDNNQQLVCTCRLLEGVYPANSRACLKR